MPIRVDCDCGRTVTVKDELAGKLVKCPDCKQPVRVPAADAEPEDAEMLDDDDRPRKRSQASRRRTDDYDDEDRPARKKKRAASRDDVDDDYDEEDDDRPRRRGGRGSWADRAGPVNGMTVTLLSIGIGVLVALGLAALPSLYSYSTSASSTNPDLQKSIDEAKKREAEDKKKLKKREPAWPGFIDTWRGIVVLIVSILIAAYAVATVILLFAAGRWLSELFVLIGSAVASGWGLLVLLWFLGYVFKGFVMSFSMTTEVPGGTVRASLTIWPSWGLWLGLLFSGAVLGVFLPLVLKRGALWGLIGLGVGGLAGLILLAADAQPWNDPLKPFKEALKEKKAPPSKLKKPWFFPEKTGVPFVSNQDHHPGQQPVAPASVFVAHARTPLRALHASAPACVRTINPPHRAHPCQTLPPRPAFCSA